MTANYSIHDKYISTDVASLKSNLRPHNKASSPVSNMLSKCLNSRRVRTIVLITCLFFVITYSSLFNNVYLDQFKQSTQNYHIPSTYHSDDVNMKLYKPSIHSLRDQLALTFPYDPESPIPHQIWQTWRNGPQDKDFPSKFRSFQKKWTSMADSTGYQYSLITDDSILPLLQNLYGEVPLVIEAYQLLPTMILKADFFRYLILFARGGIYSDMDTIPLKPFNKWTSSQESISNNPLYNTLPTLLPYKNINRDKAVLPKNEPGLVIGIEADPDREDWKEWYARRIQFCQWTIQSKPGHPVLRELILNITATTLKSVQGSPYANDDNPIFDLKHLRDYDINYRYSASRNSSNYDYTQKKNYKNVDGTDIMNWTGPGIFTDIIFEYLSNTIRTNNDIALLNTDLQQPLHDEIINEQSKSIKRFYTEISEQLLTYARIPWEFFAFLQNPAIVDDVMILPITSFSPGVEQMEAKGTNDKMAFVEHLFSGSWKALADKNSNHKKNNGGIPPVPE